MAITKIPVGQAQRGDRIMEKRGRAFTCIGTVTHVEKHVARRNVTVFIEEGGGFTQNWAAHIFVKRAA